MQARSILGALVLALLLPAAGMPQPPSLAVIVHPDRRTTATVEDLAQIYLRRKRFWDDGTPIVPLNLPAGTSIRVAFSSAVLRETEPRLGEYWNRQYFYGILPPATLASTDAVVRYVASDPNAIGYVPVSVTNGTVRVLLRLD
jgi:ABC-type phosphate transport system substrate-binding protein